MQNEPLSALSWREQVTVNEMVMMSTLYLTNTFSVLLVEETGGQTLSHNVVHLALNEVRTHNISSDRH
jgi:hypothetical protein